MTPQRRLLQTPVAPVTPPSTPAAAGRLETPPSTPAAAGRRETPAYSRRAVVAGWTALVASLAGCTTIVDFAAGFVLEDVNVLNEADEAVRGTVSVVDPTGDAVLEESFDLVPANDGPDAQAIYDGVWTDAGEYAVSVDLEAELEGESSATDRVSVADPDEEHLVISLGNDALAVAISVHVVEQFSDLADELE